MSILNKLFGKKEEKKCSCTIKLEEEMAKAKEKLESDNKEKKCSCSTEEK